MTYQRFEDLPVWQEAARLYDQTDEFLEVAPRRVRASFRDQLERAVVSVSNNIAEGFERGTNKELLAFLYISRGSAGEVRSMLCLLERLPGFDRVRGELRALKPKAESCSKQLKGWAESLQNSEMKGERYVTDKARRTTQNSREREEFLKELMEIRDKDAASRN